MWPIAALAFLTSVFCEQTNKICTEEVTFIVSVGTADYCGQVIANVDIFGALSVYSDVNHSVEKHVWNHFLRTAAYFKASFTSPSVSLFLARLDTVTATIYSRSGWVNTVTLYTSGAATALGTTVEFTVPAPYLTDVYFEFDVARLFDTLAAPINSTMTITALCTISFSNGQGKRNLESAHLVGSRHSKRLGSNTRTLRTDTTLYYGAQQEEGGGGQMSITNPLDGIYREGEEKEKDHQGPTTTTTIVLISNELTFVMGLLVVVILVLVVAKQVKSLLSG